MDETTNAESVSKDHAIRATSSLTGRWIAFIAFLILGLFLAMPCLCCQGAVAGLYKSVFYLVVICKLLYGLLRRNIDVSTFGLWIGGYIVFCIIADSLY